MSDRDSIYTPLEDEGEIRLLTISPECNSLDERINMTVYPVKILQLSHYEALSYAWGALNLTIPVRCNGHLLQVTSNLHAALSELQLEYEERVMWIDAVCINQQDNREKMHQVQQMKDIYSKATRVIMWVGPDDETTWYTFEAFKNYRNYRRDGLEPSTEALDDLPMVKLALGRFSGQSYFERAWILQEVILSRDGIVQCGRFASSIRDVYDSLAWLGLANAFPIPSGETDRVFRLLWWRSHRHAATEFPLKSYTLFAHARTLKTSDPRDKVFALLGIAEDNESLGLVADYAMSVEETYVTVCKRLLEKYGPFILCDVLPRSRSIDLPSWVPDWRDAVYMKGIDSQKHRPFRAGGLNGAELHFPGESLRLSVKGVRIDNIHVVKDPNPILGDDRWLYCDLEQWIAETLTEIGSSPNEDIASSLRERCLRTMSADLSALSTREVGSRRQTRFPIHYEWSRSKHASDAPPIEVLDELAEFVWNFMNRRKLFLSRTGYLGLGPETMQQGDIVCVFLGGDTPFILRPQDTGEYTFIGETYVDGIMDGEALQNVAADQHEDFMLR